MSYTYVDATADLRTRLQKLSNSCIRYMYRVRMCERITPFRWSLRWLRTDTRSLYFAAILMYEIIRLNKLKYLASFFQKYQPRGPMRGERRNLAILSVRTDTGLSSFQVRCAHLWNSFPSSVRYYPTLSDFGCCIQDSLPKT